MCGFMSRVGTDLSPPTCPFNSMTLCSAQSVGVRVCSAVCVCVCLCRCTCMCVYVCVHSCSCQRLTSGVVPRVLSTLLIFRQGLLWAWGFLSKPDCLTIEFQESSCLHLAFKMWVLRLGLEFKSLCGKQIGLGTLHKGTPHLYWSRDYNGNK